MNKLDKIIAYLDEQSITNYNIVEDETTDYMALEFDDMSIIYTEGTYMVDTYDPDDDYELEESIKCKSETELLKHIIWRLS